MSFEKMKDDNMDDLQPIKIKSVVNEIEAELIMNLFRNNNIQCFKKSKGIGGYMNIYMGYSIYGEDIYVSQRDYDKALILLDELSFQDELIEEEENNNDYYTPFLKNPKIIARVILIVMIGIIILSCLIDSNKIISLFQ